MADIYTDATRLAVLAAGRDPKWSRQHFTTFLVDTPPWLLCPQSSASGVPLERSLRALAYVALRSNAAGRRAMFVLGTFNLTATYALTIGGTTISYDAAADGAASRQDIIEGIVAAIVANGTTNALVTASAVSTVVANGIDTVLLVGKAEQGYSFGPFVATPGGTSSYLAAEPEGARVRVWFSMDAAPGVTPPGAWVKGDEDFVVDRAGRVKRYDVAGLVRMHLQLIELAGHAGDAPGIFPFHYDFPIVQIGPCLGEEG